MFDLFRSRDKAVRILLGAVLLVVAFSMVTYLIPNYDTGQGGPQDTVVASIGKDKITLREAQLVIQNALRGRSLPPEMMPLYIPQMIDQMVTERALAYQAKRMGLQVTEDDIVNAIRLSVPQLFPEGKFVGRELYAQVLAQQNLTIQEYEADTERQVLLNRLRVIAVEGTVISQTELEQEYRQRNDKVKIEYVKIAQDKYRTEVKVSDAGLRAYYDKNRANFNVPAKKSLAILVIDQAKLEQSLAPTDADLRRVYDSDKDRFRTSERVKVRHILLNTTGKTPEEEAKIKTQAEDLLKQVKAKADFAELAKKYSEDKGSAVKGGDLDWVVRGQTVKPFEDAAFSLKPGEISNLVKTEYGYHILQVQAHEEARLRSFDDVKTQLTDEFRKTRVSQMMQDLMDHAQSALRSSPQKPDQVAADLKLPPPIHVENVSPGDPLPEIGVNADFQKATTGLNQGEVSQAVAIPPNKVVMAVVTGVTPMHPATFEDAQKQIRPVLERQKLEELVTQKANALMAEAKASGDLRKAAKSLGLEVKTPPEVDRHGAIEGLGQADFLAEAFSKPEGALVGPVTVPDGRVLAKVVSHVPADMTQLAVIGDNLRNELKQKKARERNALFEDGVRQELIKEGKVKIHQDVINRLIANYRS